MPASEPMPDAPAILLGLLAFGVLIGSLILWLRYLFADWKTQQEDPGPLPDWKIGWVNFGLFLCLLVISVFAAQQVTFLLIDTPSDPDAGLTPWMAVAAVGTLHLPMLAAFLASRQLWPHLYGGPLNRRPLSIGRATRSALAFFLRYLPLVWIVSLAWSLVLVKMQDAGAMDEAAPQEIVLIFSRGGDPAAITVLALMAILLAPIVEELVFRGCIYRFLKSAIPLFAAQLISAALFALLHASITAFPALLLLGVLFARSYERTGNLLVPVIFHALFNAFTLLTLLLVSQSSAAGL